MVDLQQSNDYMRIIQAPILLPPSANNINSLISENLTIKGNVNIGDNGTLTIEGTPIDDGDAVTKSYIDSITNTVKWKDPARVATTANITLSGEQTIDGIAVVSGNRVLVKNQTNGIQNGIYVASTGAWSRSSDLAVGSNASSVTLWVEEGTVSEDVAYLCTNNVSNGTVGTNSLVFAQVSSTAQITAGSGITKTGETISVNNTVILTTGGQTITGTLDVTSTIEAGTITDGTASMTGGAITTADLTIDNMLNQTGTNQILTSNTIDGTQGNVNTQGDITLYNATTNTIFFRDTGSGPPSFTTRSAGTKIVLYPAISGSTVDYAIGVDGNDLWFSVPDSTKQFDFVRQGIALNRTVLSGTGTLTAQKTTFTMTGTYTANTFNFSGNTVSNGLVSISSTSVTQLVSITEPVTVNDASGLITTFASTAAASSVTTFTVNNSFITSTTHAVHVDVTDYTGSYGTNGIPVVTVSNLGVGSFEINILNVGTNAFNGSFVISFFLF